MYKAIPLWYFRQYIWIKKINPLETTFNSFSNQLFNLHYKESKHFKQARNKSIYKSILSSQWEVWGKIDVSSQKEITWNFVMTEDNNFDM